MADPIQLAMTSDVFRRIQTRLSAFNPPILVEDHLVDDSDELKKLDAAKVKPLSIERTILGGIDFAVKDRDELIAALNVARTGDEKAFIKGGTSKEDWKDHWALAISFMATDGIGFREPWRQYLNDRALRISDARPARLHNWQDPPEMDDRFSGNFGNDIKLDFSALHAAVARFGTLKNPRTMCNIHVDETGIAMAAADGDVVITLSALPHLLNELLFKTKLEGKLPDWFIDRFNLNILSPGMNYSKVGVSFDLAKGKNFRWTISGSWGLAGNGRFEWTGTTSLSGRHDIGGGGR
jgi:hypothetical protein